MTREEAIQFLTDTGISPEHIMELVEALEQKPCKDAISRQAAIYVINHAQVNFSVESEIDFTKHEREVHEIIDNILGAQEKALKELPPVTAEKVGRWEWNQYDSNPKIGNFHCSQCHGIGKAYYDYCPYCGSRMTQEVEE